LPVGQRISQLDAGKPIMLGIQGNECCVAEGWSVLVFCNSYCGYVSLGYVRLGYFIDSARRTWLGKVTLD